MVIRTDRPRPAAAGLRPLALVLGLVALLGAGGIVGALVLRSHATSAPDTSADVLHFHSRPDLTPDRVRVLVRRPGAARGDILLAVKRGPGQDGPMILDGAGRLVWFHPVAEELAATSFSVQRYRGRPVLVWWEGHTKLGHGMGWYVVMDQRYRVVARISAGGALAGDHHEIQLTPQGTALMSVYQERPADLSAVGGRRDGRIFDSIVREVDVASGRVLFTWHAIDHVALTESYARPRRTVPHDYFHVNSIDVDHDGDLLVSARNTRAVYKIDRRSGRVIWRLGGKRSDFRLAPGARFALQHDARRHSDGTISLFDNEATPRVGPQSRGIVLRLNRRQGSARLVRAYTHPGGLLSIAEGNMEELRNGNVFVGWGPAHHVSEYTHGGRLVFDALLPLRADTYRAYRQTWRGEPVYPPVVAAKRGDGGRIRAWASWNGATEVRAWQLLAGPRRDALAPAGTPVPRINFETTLHAASGTRWVAVQALDASGRVLATSHPVFVGG